MPRPKREPNPYEPGGRTGEAEVDEIDEVEEEEERRDAGRTTPKRGTCNSRNPPLLQTLRV